MAIPLQITFRDVELPHTVEEWIRAEAAKLERFYRRPVGCRVIVERPHRHHRKGSVFHICIDITLPGGRIVVAREPALANRVSETEESWVRKHLELRHQHKDLRLAIKDAFKAVERQLRDYGRRQRGDVKTHRPRFLRSKGSLSDWARSVALQSDTGARPLDLSLPE